MGRTTAERTAIARIVDRLGTTSGIVTSEAQKTYAAVNWLRRQRHSCPEVLGDNFRFADGSGVDDDKPVSEDLSSGLGYKKRQTLCGGCLLGSD